MANYQQNFGNNNGPVNCPLCGLQLDNQYMAFYNCQVIKENIEIKGTYEQIFKQSVPEDYEKHIKTHDVLIGQKQQNEDIESKKTEEQKETEKKKATGDDQKLEETNAAEEIRDEVFANSEKTVVEVIDGILDEIE